MVSFIECHDVPIIRIYIMMKCIWNTNKNMGTNFHLQKPKLCSLLYESNNLIFDMITVEGNTSHFPSIRTNLHDKYHMLLSLHRHSIIVFLDKNMHYVFVIMNKIFFIIPSKSGQSIEYENVGR